MIKKADIILGAALIVIGLAITGFLFTLDDPGQLVKISVGGREYGTYPLQEDRVIEIRDGNSLNQITIKDGCAAMTFSNCRGKDCVHRGAISKTSETIACLPHEILVEITGEKKTRDSQEFDAVVQ